MSTLPYTSEEIAALLSKISGKQLLDNWDFRNPVNQRGQSSYSASTTAKTYTIDRWFLQYADTSVSVTTGGVTIASSGASAAHLRQFLEADLPDGYYTLTAKTTSGVYRIRILEKSGSSYTTISSSGTIANGDIDIQTTNGLPLVFIYATVGNSISVEAVKLESGTVSTLANDPPGDYAETLRKCQRYLQIVHSNPQVPIFFIDAYKNTVTFPVTMRAIPDIIPFVGNSTLGSIDIITRSIDGFHWVIYGDSPYSVYLAGYIADASL